MRHSPTNPFPHDTRLFKGFSDWIELNPIKGAKDFTKGITSGDLDRLATPPMIKDAGRPSVALNYMKATYDPSKSYSFNEDTKRNANAKAPATLLSKQVTIKPIDRMRQMASASTNTSGKTLLQG